MDNLNFSDLCCNSSLIYRLKYGGGHKKQPITKAVGTSHKHLLKVIDATSGLGTDAIVLAYFNCKVYAIERDLTVAELLKKRLLMAKNSDILQPVVDNISLFKGDCREVIPSIIRQINCLPDVIYLDPMFDEKIKAAPNKLIQILQSTLTIGSKPKLENNDLLAFSLLHASKRVVVKRSKRSNYLENIKPSFSLKGKRNRFDVYITNVNT